jgi:TonB-linked SusC/RagA family outer membrane protein
MQPIVPVYDIMGNFAGTRASGTGNAGSPMFNLWSNRDDRTKRLIVSGNTYLKLNIMEGLSFRSLVGINYSTNHSKDYSFVEIAEAERGKYDGYSESASFGLQWSWTNTIEYSKLFAGVHDFKLILGSEAIDNMSNNFNASRSEYTFLDADYITLDTGLQGINNGGGNSSYSLFSLFGRFNYTFSDKYMLEGVIRRDGSSRFGNEKYGIFPAFSVGWRVSEEGFMASTSAWLDELKIRGGWGKTGNDRIGNYNSYSNFAMSFSSAFYPIDGSNSSAGAVGFRQTTFGNTNVKWEATSTSNIGIDASLFNRLNLTVDLWQRVTSDMLYRKQIPLIEGNITSPMVNIGEMKNSGFDIELGYNGDALNNELRYNFALVFSHYKNELIKLTGTESEFYEGSAYREQRYTRTETGRAFPEFYGYIVDGIFQTQSEVDAAPPAFGPTGDYNKPGHYKYRDVDGNGYVDSNDRVYLGSPHPDFTAGMNFSIMYKGISLSTQLFSSVGNEVINYVRRFTDFVQFQGGRSHDRLYNSWGSPYLSDNSQAKLPMAEVDDTRSQVPSSAFIENGSYLRMKTLRLGYDLNNLLKGKFRNVQVYGQITNLFTLTKYSGLDPEIGGGGINMGIDSGAWPTPRQFMFGISLGI